MRRTSRLFSLLASGLLTLLISSNRSNACASEQVVPTDAPPSAKPAGQNVASGEDAAKQIVGAWSQLCHEERSSGMQQTKYTVRFSQDNRIIVSAKSMQGVEEDEGGEATLPRMRIGAGKWSTENGDLSIKIGTRAGAMHAVIINGDWLKIDDSSNNTSGYWVRVDDDGKETHAIPQAMKPIEVVVARSASKELSKLAFVTPVDPGLNFEGAAFQKKSLSRDGDIIDVFQFAKVQCFVDSDRLSEADRLNGVRWRGTVRFTSSVVRTKTAKSLVLMPKSPWDDWRSNGRLVEYFGEMRNEELKLKAVRDDGAENLHPIDPRSLG